MMTRRAIPRRRGPGGRGPAPGTLATALQSDLRDQRCGRIQEGTTHTLPYASHDELTCSSSLTIEG